jgi:hypothetical protein
MLVIIYRVAAKHKCIRHKISVNNAGRARRCDRIERPDRYLQRPRHGKAGVAKAGIAVDGALGDVVVSSKRGTASNCYVPSGSWLCKNVLAEALTSGGDPGRGGRVR